MGMTLFISCERCKIPLGKVEALNGANIVSFGAECAKCNRIAGLQNMRYKLVKKKQLPEVGASQEMDEESAHLLNQQSRKV